MNTKYILVHNEVTNKNIICSYSKENMTTEYLQERVCNFFDIDNDDICDIEIISQEGKQIERYNNIESIFTSMKKINIDMPESTYDNIIKLQLSYSSKIKEIERQIKQKKFEEDAQILLNLTQCNNTFNISLCTLTNKIFSIMITPTTTIGALKHYIEKKEGIPSNAQRIYFAKKMCIDDDLISSYNLSQNDKLYLVLNLRGGMFVLITSGNDDYNKIISNQVDINLDDGFTEM
jgi:hypothetical protein